MAEYPALPLFTDAFLADTLHLTAAQLGAYMLMLMTAWRTSDCTLPDDDSFLARICRMDKRTWAANRDTLLAFWCPTSETKLFQKRLKDERNYVDQKRNKNSASGKASALKRKNRGSTPVQPKRNVIPTPTPTPTIEVGKPTSPPTPKTVRMPFDLIPPEWSEWAMTERGWTPVIVANVWSLFRDYWKTGKGKNTKREDWLESWKNWCLKENIQPRRDHANTAPSGNRGVGGSHQQGPSSPGSKWDAERQRIERKWELEERGEENSAGGPDENLRSAEAVR